MGANRSENSSYTAAIKKIKHVKRKVVVDKVHPLQNVNQSRSKAGIELSAVEVELSAAEVGPSAAEAELSNGEVVLSAVEVGVSAAKLVSSPRSKKSSSPKKQLPASEYEIVEVSQSSVWQFVNLIPQRSLLPLPQVHPKQSPSQNPGALHLRDCNRLYLL